MPAATDLPKDSGGIAINDRTAREIGNHVEALVAEALSPRRRQWTPESLSTAFLMDLMRFAEEEGVELSEDDCVYLLREVRNLEESLKTAKLVCDTLDEIARMMSDDDPFREARSAGWNKW